MKEAIGNLWDHEADVVCITTNGFVKSNGAAVMGRGCAAEALAKVPGIDTLLGGLIRDKGNKVFPLTTVGSALLVTFPVKPEGSISSGSLNVVHHMVTKFIEGSLVPGWACKASLHIIRESAKQLRFLADYNDWASIVLPRPGCGAGELKWEDVKPVLEEYFDDRFTVITFK